MNTLHQQNVVLRSPYFPAINWGAILAGVVVGLALQLVLALLGFATGLSAVDMSDARGGLSNGPLWAGIWQGATMLISAFVGGYVAARMSGLHRKSDGILHGFVAWGVTTLLFAALATSAVGSLFGGLFDTIGKASAQHSAAPASSAGGTSQLEALIRGNASSGTAGPINADTLRALQQSIQAGRREDAINLMVQSLGLDRERAATVVDQALILTGSPERASPGAQAEANRSVETASIATWSVFGAVALSLLLGIIGGLIGALATRRRPRVMATQNY